MNVVVDTTVFSLFVRRTVPLNDPHLSIFLDLFAKNRILLLGVVYQELLSGVRHESQFRRLERILESFVVELATQDDHKVAATFYNRCRTNGIQGSAVDFLICAMAYRRDCEILTLDEDFTHYAAYTPIRLLIPPQPTSSN